MLTAKVHDSQVLTELVHGEEEVIAGDTAYANQMLKANCRQVGVCYFIHDKASPRPALSARQLKRNRRKFRVRAKEAFPFRLIKHLWGHAKVCYRGLAKNPSRLHLLFALANLYHVRKSILAAD